MVIARLRKKIGISQKQVEISWPIYHNCHSRYLARVLSNRCEILLQLRQRVIWQRSLETWGYPQPPCGSWFMAVSHHLFRSYFSSAISFVFLFSNSLSV